MTQTGAGDPVPQLAPDYAPSLVPDSSSGEPADAESGGLLTVEWRSLAELGSFANAWRELAGVAIEPNVFYEPAFAMAAAPVFGRHAGAALVWSDTTPRKLLGFFPASIARRRYGFALPVLVGWTHPYAPLGTPLVAREAAEPVIASWLSYLESTPALPAIMLLPFVPKDGAFASALAAVLRRKQTSAVHLNRHTRALLAPQGKRSEYVANALGPRKHRELRRIARRLGELGATTVVTAAEPSSVAAATADFLMLEASGWKGKSGTAAACRADVRRFVQSALADLAAQDKVAIDRIVLDGHSLAAAITLRSANGAWLWKIAYDETFSRYSPGVALTASVTEKLAADTTIAWADSCAVAVHPVMDRTWSERLALSDLMIAVRPRAPFARARALERIRCRAIAAARSLRGRLRVYSQLSLPFRHARAATVAVQ